MLVTALERVLEKPVPRDHNYNIQAHAIPLQPQTCHSDDVAAWFGLSLSLRFKLKFELSLSQA
jgi:hypothetical protein